MQTSELALLRSRLNRLSRKGNNLGALKALDRLIELEAADANDWCLTGTLLCNLGEFAQAVGAFRECIALDPGHLEAKHDLGRALYKLGDADKAAEFIEKVAEETGHPEVWMGLATIAPGVPSLDNLRVRRIREKFANLVEKHQPPLPRFQNRSSHHRGKLRIGYLSAHFHDAKYMKPVWPMINAQDVEQFDICLFDDAANNDADWDWLNRDNVEIHSVYKLDNSQLTETIRNADIDVLVDLSAYSKPERLGVYVYRAAPVQMAWFNMYATSGLAEMDYIVGDRFAIRSNEKRFYSEQTLRLPVSYLTFQTTHQAPPVNPSPFQQNGYFTFGCLGTLYKITQPVIQAWSKILRKAPDDTRLLLANADLKSACNQEYLLERFAGQGIDRGRVAFLPPTGHFDYLKYYDQIDLALDTFPYNGGTTTMEAVWQGVPVLTFGGDRWASRTSQSILGHCHLGEFIAKDVDGYVKLGIEYASDAKKQASLPSLRDSMRDALSASDVCDSKRLAREIEKLFKKAMVEAEH